MAETKAESIARLEAELEALRAKRMRILKQEDQGYSRGGVQIIRENSNHMLALGVREKEILAELARLARNGGGISVKYVVTA